MIQYKKLHRHWFDQLFHRAMFMLLSVISLVIPFSVELRTYVITAIEALSNLCKFMFRPTGQSATIIDDIINEYKLSYEEPGQERVAIITGATSGLGRVIALAVGRAGFHLVLPVRNMPKAERLRQEILTQCGAMVTLMECDLAKPESVQGFAENFKRMGRRISLLICNAGIAATSGTVHGMEPNMAVNFIAHYRLIELLSDVLDTPPRDAYGTRIISVTSASFYAVDKLTPNDMVNRHWFERFAPYARSKFAQVLQTVELANRFKGRLTVNAMEPGMVRTDIYRYDPFAAFLGKYVLPFLAPVFIGIPEDGAVTAVWLALSPDVHAVTGKVFADLHETPLGLNTSNVLQVEPRLISSLMAKIE